MAKEKKTKQPDTRPPLEDKDNPSLVEVGGKLCLRVFEDFFVERELPKWKNFEAQKRAFLKEIGASISSATSYENSLTSGSVKDMAIKAGEKNPAEAKQIADELARLKKMQEMVSDDRWGIKDKHEKEVDESVRKTAVYLGYKPKTLKGKVRAFFGRLAHKEARKPVEIAFDELKDSMTITSSEQLMQARGQLEYLIEGYKKAGQYGKAETAKKLVPQLAHELAIAKMGYTKYVTESQMIDFVKKSERGVMVDFLRYYEGSIPAEVVQRKAETDEKMVFDNYVIAYYADLKKKAVAKEEKQKEQKREKATAVRRDPILFGIVKQTRKLYYICDWITPEDDLTLDKLEEVLGHSAKVLFSENSNSRDPVVGIEEDRSSSLVYRDVSTTTLSRGDPSRFWYDNQNATDVYYALEYQNDRIRSLERQMYGDTHN